MFRLLFTLISLYFIAHRVHSQPVSTTTTAPLPESRWQTNYWDARWIVPGNGSVGEPQTATARQYGIYHFRKTITLAQVPGRFIVHVSADNRYRLFVNGQPVALGPARSDLLNWNYETLDLAPFLKPGNNVIAAQVWYLSESAPFAQMSYQVGFVMQGDTEIEKVVNTDKSWKSIRNDAYEPLKTTKLNTYIVVGDGDRVTASKYPWGWEQSDFDDSQWLAANQLWFPAKPRGLGSDGNWALVPRQIPMMETFQQRLKTVRRTDNGRMTPAFLDGKAPVEVPAKTKAVFLLDQTYLTNAYPELTVSRGKGATITLAYAEALVNEKGQKGNRNEVEKRQLIGFEDQFIADGQRRTFRPLWFRTYRYLQITVETASESVVLEDITGQYTGYPLAEKAKFASSDSTLTDIWNVGWRTARLCAGETYFDCPYYEQLQYVGDTRVQAMISLYVAGDERLMRKAILDFDHSRIPDGLTQSRYPSADLQVIPTFSLLWVCMVHDYWMHRQDDAFVKSLLPGMASVLRWHEQRMAPNNLNGPLEWWNFVDWAWPWSEETRIGGVPPGVRDGSSTLSLQQAYTYLLAAEVFAHYGQNDVAGKYRGLAARIKKAVRETCWDASRGLMADTPEGRTPEGRTPAKKSFSQHANILAILTDAVPIAQQPALLQKIIDPAALAATDITQATFYFKYYLFQALKKTGMGNQLVPQLKPWRDMLALGLTTFAEQPDRSDGASARSDCHAWSASPLYEFLSTVCGINPAEPGFRSVRIEPFLGTLTFAEGQMPHPAGEIAVWFKKTPTGGLKGTVSLPAGVGGSLIWNGKTVVLKGGKQEIAL